MVDMMCLPNDADAEGGVGFLFTVKPVYCSFLTCVALSRKVILNNATIMKSEGTVWGKYHETSRHLFYLHCFVLTLVCSCSLAELVTEKLVRQLRFYGL